MLYTIKSLTLRFVARIIKYVVHLAGFIRPLNIRQGPLSRSSLIRVYDKDNKSVSILPRAESHIRNLSASEINSAKINYLLQDENIYRIEFNFVPHFISKRNELEIKFIDNNSDRRSISLREEHVELSRLQSEISSQSSGETMGLEMSDTD